eukprot:Hpha_TRINITY_DN1163_c0_g1::TRINITY_DN1163_c0_g1_i1::g.113048::m.113048
MAESPATLVSIRTGTSTASYCVGTLHLRIDSTLADVRQQLTALASASRQKRRSKDGSDAASSEPPRGPVSELPPPPPLTQEQRDRLGQLKLHPFDFTSPFQFVIRGGALPIARRSEGVTKIKEVFPVRPDLDDRGTSAAFEMPSEVDVIRLPPSTRKIPPPEAARKKKRRPPVAGFDLDLEPMPGIPDVLATKSKWRPAIPRSERGFVSAFACIFVRQGDGTDTLHSEKVVMERLLMQNNVFGRLQTPQQLGTLINKYNANTRDFLGRTILQECAQEGNYYVTAFLLGLSFVDVDARDWRGQTALHLAVDRGHLEVVTLLLDANADPIALDRCGKSPLHLALERRADVLVSRLCARLHANGVTHEQLRECRLAGDSESKDPVALFEILSPDFSSLCRDGQLPALRALWQHYLFDRRLAFEAQMNGRSALHEAAECCQDQVVDFLLEVVGFDVQAQSGCQDETKRTPMHLAAQRGATEIVRRLYSQGMDANARDINLCTPLHCALYSKRWHTAEALLIEVRDIEVNVMDAAGHTPLHIASANNLYSVCELLLTRCGANVGLRSESVSTAAPRLPAADVLKMDAEARCQFRTRVQGRERRWRLRSWTAEWKERRRDTDGRLKLRENFSSPENWDAATRRRPLRTLQPAADPALHHRWVPPYERSFERRCALIYTPYNTPSQDVASDQLLKKAPADLLCWRKSRRGMSEGPAGELVSARYGQSEHVKSGLGWLHAWRGGLLPRPPVVTLTLRRPDSEHGARPDFGVEWGDGMIVDRVQGGSWAERSGLSEYARLTP